MRLALVARLPVIARLALVAVFLAVIPSTAVAGPPRVLYDTILPEVFYLEVEREGVKEATFVEPRADGMVALTAPNGTVEYVPMYRVRRVVDQDGVDLTNKMRRREWLGTPPPKPIRTKTPTVWKPFRLRAGPRSACGSYLITDMSMMRPGDLQRGHAYWATDWGYAWNVGPHHSIGATAFFGAIGADRTQLGMRLRLARWFRPNVSFDLSPGILLVDHEQGYSGFKCPGFSSQVGVTAGGRVGLVAQVFSARRRETLYRWYSTSSREVRETSWHLGIRLGAEPGIVGTSALFLAEMATLGTTPVYAPIF